MKQNTVHLHQQTKLQTVCNGCKQYEELSFQNEQHCQLELTSFCDMQTSTGHPWKQRGDGD